jgi:hypothetical protein
MVMPKSLTTGPLTTNRGHSYNNPHPPSPSSSDITTTCHTTSRWIVVLLSSLTHTHTQSYAIVQ